MPRGKRKVAPSRDYPAEYRAWIDAKYRCHNPKAHKYPDYGERGIEMCEEWRENFFAFLKDVGRKPGPGYSIDRIDNDGNYEPGNVKWSTPKEQQRNRRPEGKTVRCMTLDGKTQTLAEWAEELEINRSTLKDRVWKGWSDEEALTRPVCKRPRRSLPLRGRKTKSPKPSLAQELARRAQEAGVCVELVRSIYKQGWSIEASLRAALELESSPIPFAID